jgi:hypothetical protein
MTPRPLQRIVPESQAAVRQKEAVRTSEHLDIALEEAQSGLESPPGPAQFDCGENILLAKKE